MEFDVSKARYQTRFTTDADVDGAQDSYPSFNLDLSLYETNSRSWLFIAQPPIYGVKVEADKNISSQAQEIKLSSLSTTVRVSQTTIQLVAFG